MEPTSGRIMDIEANKARRELYSCFQRYLIKPFRDPPHRTPKPPTRAEREYLVEDKRKKLTGFHPRAEQRFAVHPDVTEEFLRRKNALLKHHCPSISSRGWLTLGRLDPIFPPRSERVYNSNVWRYYVSQSAGHHANRDHERFPNLIASLYPITIPTPSSMRGNTWLRFVSCGNLYIDIRGKKKAIGLLEKELADDKKLTIKSESRMPPIDIFGNIIPPENQHGYVAGTPVCCRYLTDIGKQSTTLDLI
ncbi:testis-expressed protein 52 [Amblyraja radiata]|uniref:testis-expressed protein 52 n=1 Tax=Amblyraja radiata TaxID=386614 RepID=UPI00140203D1|nr:testis-expressed protein 52 [Amblyraja radiata]